MDTKEHKASKLWKTRGHKVLRVRRTKAQAKKTYDKLSRFYEFYPRAF